MRGSGPSPTVLVLTGAAGPAPELVDTLGPERADAVRALLVRRALEWAQAAFGAEAVESVAAGSFAAALASGPGRARASTAGARSGPVIAVAAALPVWHDELAGAVLSDLEAGCVLALAPMFDRGLYLLALADGSAEQIASLAELDVAGPGGMTELIGLAQRERWDVGLLRAERGLRRARDVHALLADPLTDGELRALLG